MAEMQQDAVAAGLRDRTTCFDGYVLCTRPFSLSRAGRPIDVPRQSLELLDYLIACRDRIATREELIDRFWSTGHLGADQNLNTCVRRLRKALAESGDAAGLIETHARLGYRFVGDIDAQPETPARRTNRAARFLPQAAAGFVVLAACGWAIPMALSSETESSPRLPVERIAVPPGRNMCDTTLFPRFIDGLRENLISDLETSSGDEVSFLKVGSREPSNGANSAPYFLDLGVRQMPDRTIANLSLISARDGEVVWTRQIAEPTNMDNYLVTQERLASQLATAFVQRRP